ncbi:hypothetical protein A2Z33_02510 [Candidatus Gottesmanbacteria bacterium RBG_16_52_11]|uniref:Beta-lactamase class A catalytic domain-containing protein n=1 Tax=Candidatus Gottesmanbacteria bacterium RBG_16_52_11 TaxID=1798374 RepID=A0A1F5YMI2_9BACT|nr:MAG: hypothetical protein A2Z33_02510 [Candidatus Gottesmanbacteria bacterium RBG_16_52_11]
MFTLPASATARRRQRKSSGKIIIIIGIILIVLALLRRDSGAVISPLPESPQPTNAPELPVKAGKKNRNPLELENSIRQAVGNAWKNYSVVVEDMNSSFTVSIDGMVMHRAASVNKVPILAALYVLSERGETDLNRVITLQAGDIQNYGTGSIRYDSPGSTYSVKTLAKLMIQKSDNTAAYILAQYIVGQQRLKKMVSDFGLVQTDMDENTTSNADMAKLFRKIYRNELTNQAYSGEMLAFLKDSDFEDRLPGKLPPGTTIYHKIGTEVGNIHDVGIVETPDGAFYIGVLTSDVTDETQATELIAMISRLVYDFML